MGVPVVADPDGSVLLSTAAVHDLLVAAVEHAGGTLGPWRLDHLDASPGRSTTATYLAEVTWPTDGVRRELLGASVRVGGRSGNDERAVIFGDGDREVAVWIYPDDPDLPGLRRATVPAELRGVLAEHSLVPPGTAPANVQATMISYRPRRRAVLRVRVAGPRPVTYYVKVLRPSSLGPTLDRHAVLLRAGVPAPAVAAATADSILVLRELAGRPLAQAMFDEPMPCTAEDLIGLLDSLPPAVSALPRRAPWTDAVAAYAEIIRASLPGTGPRLAWLVREITVGLAGCEPGVEATHGDFHEGQLFVSGGRICGLADVDTIGPGRRADDLACLIGHLSTVQRMSKEQAAGLGRLISLWLRVFDTRVDPRELRLRTAAVIISLATGPHRGQEPDWQRETWRMLNTAETLVRSAVG